jgi:bile acid-coenzyme A ligase
MTGPRIVSLGRRLTELAHAHPQRPAVIMKRRDRTDDIISYGDLDAQSNRGARLLSSRGVGATSRVALAAPNSIAYFVATYAIWKLGACVFPIRSDLPKWERDRLVEAARPTHVIGSFDDLDLPQVRLSEMADLEAWPAAELPDAVPHPYKVNATGGSTGLPKIVIPDEPGTVRADDPRPRGANSTPPGHVQLVVGPLYHYGPSLNAISALNAGSTVVALEAFDAALVMVAIETHRIDTGMLVPTMLYRVLELPDLGKYDVSSLQRLSIAGAKCPDWVFEKAIGIFGPERLFVGYGGTENIGMASATGAEWLAHKGTTGKPISTEVQILDDQGSLLPTGEIGEIWMRPRGGLATRYASGALRSNADGFATFGDMGWLDADGYLYIADRRNDLIVTGGANVYPAEVEAALLQHPGVSDAAVVGAPDAEWGATVHAVIVPAGPERPGDQELREFCRRRLAAYKVPKSFATLDALPRDDLGKLRRSALLPAAPGR